MNNRPRTKKKIADRYYPKVELLAEYLPCGGLNEYINKPFRTKKGKVDFYELIRHTTQTYEFSERPFTVLEEGEDG